MSAILELKNIVEKIQSDINVTSEGVGILSIRAVSRICEVYHSSLSRHFSGVQNGDLNPSKLAKTLIQYGFEPWCFSKNGIPDTAAFLIIEYYANKAGNNCTEAAKKALIAIGAIGMRQFCREATGWKAEKPEEKVTDIVTVESMFSTMMEMRYQMNEILVVAKQQVETLQEEVKAQKLITAEKEGVIEQMIEKELIREVKFRQYPGLKEATDYALSWDVENQEEIFYTLKEFCDQRDLRLTRGQKIQVGKLATDFCRLAIMRKMPKTITGHTLYSSRFEPMIKIALKEVLELN